MEEEDKDYLEQSDGVPTDMPQQQIAMAIPPDSAMGRADQITFKASMATQQMIQL